MTSKEAIQVLKNHNNRKYELVNKRRYAVSVIEQDLEILEILKKRLNIKIPYGSLTVISANNNEDYLLFEVELKEHTKIEEWLERKE